MAKLTDYVENYYIAVMKLDNLLVAKNFIEKVGNDDKDAIVQSYNSLADYIRENVEDVNRVNLYF